MKRPRMRQMGRRLAGAGRVDLGAMMDDSRIVDLEETDKEAALNRMVDVLATAPQVTDPEALRRAIFEREAVMSTGGGIGVAAPHAKIPSVTDFAIALGRSKRGIDFDSLDGKPVYLIVMIAASERQVKEHLHVLAGLMARLKEASFRRRILEADGPGAIRAAFAAPHRAA